MASPLVMATRDSCVRLSPVRLASHSCLRLDPLPPASQGGSATRNDERHPHHLLRLRCAPPSTMSTKASESEASRERSDLVRFTPKRAKAKRVASAQKRLYARTAACPATKGRVPRRGSKRTGRDSNPRYRDYPIQQFSKLSPSASRAPVRGEAHYTHSEAAAAPLPRA